MTGKPVYRELRALDQDVEKETARFLDMHYYSWFKENAQRINDRDEQLKGKDVILSSPKYGLRNAIIDEKSASHYVAFEGQHSLPTFAFELSFIRGSGDWTMGWLLDPEKVTEYYLVTWPWTKKKNCIPYDFGRKDKEGKNAPYYFYTCEDIVKLEFALISRKKLLDYLAEKGFTSERLLQDEQEIRRNKGNWQWLNDLKKRIEEEQGFNFSDNTKPKTGFYYALTDSLKEKPVNLVIYKETIKEIAEKMSVIYPRNE